MTNLNNLVAKATESKNGKIIITTLVLLIAFLGAFISGILVNNFLNSRIVDSVVTTTVLPTTILPVNNNFDCSKNTDKSGLNTLHPGSVIKVSTKIQDYCYLYINFSNSFSDPGNYSVEFPKEWTFSLAGVSGPNLSFNYGVAAGSDQAVLFEPVGEAKYDITQIEKSTAYSEGSYEPMIQDPTEKTLDVKYLTTSAGEVKATTTSLGSKAFRRYYLIHENMGKKYLFSFQVDKTLNTVVNTDSLAFYAVLEKVIATLSSAQPQ